MLYLVRMDVTFPQEMPAEERSRLQEAEKAFSQSVQRDGRFVHLWRVVGEYANYSVFDVASNDELHSLLSSFPLFPYMTMKVTPLAQHPNAIT
ncbi:MAG: muconolactone Delta-isomerase [Microbacteriaceae bacterium]|uniref:muconolactone Delta-isomerase n=1 Tax=unclassified Microbacterium TaxID=2609290 RepID=UPI00097F3E8D|nr:muconolactone Delta-isomerase [Microbacterium sp. JB110]RCS60342.1 muconolactone Delta-isomerase [Microbacterium sp. JB110]SJM48866.1 Muconolactone isomerase [Frigoribacterium sp. JB110]